MSFRLVPKSATLNDLERRNHKWPLYCVISLNFVNTCVPTHNCVDLWLNLCTSLLYFVVRARCRREESSRSLSHLLISFLSLHNDDIRVVTVNEIMPLHWTCAYRMIISSNLHCYIHIYSRQ